MLAITVSALVVLGCGGDETGETLTLQPGTYRATELVVTPAGESPIDFLAGGGSMVITIDANLATSGRFFVPGEIDADMAGTAEVNGPVVTFTQEADTIVSELEFTLGVNTLTADQALGSTEYRVVLEREL